MGPVEKAMDQNWTKLEDVVVRKDGQTMVLVAIMANQQLLARALDRIGTQACSGWNEEDFTK